MQWENEHGVMLKLCKEKVVRRVLYWDMIKMRWELPWRVQSALDQRLKQDQDL